MPHDESVLRRRHGKGAKEAIEAAVDPEPEPKKERSSSERLDGLDGLRCVAALMIAAFHGICWLVMLQRDQEKHQVAGSWFGASMYVVVDLFLALTGFLIARSAIRAAARAKDAPPVWLDLRSMRGRFWRLMPPYLGVVMAAAWLFAGDRTWPRMYTRSEWTQRINELFGPGNPWQGASLAMAPANFLMLQSLAPYGGFLIHLWSLGLQYAFLLWGPPLLGRVLRKPSASGAAAVAGWCTLLHAVLRGLMWAKLNSFGGATDLSGYVHFSFYVAMGARFLPFALGAALAVGMADEGTRRAWSSFARSSGVAGWAIRLGMLLLGVCTFAGNTLWEHTLGHPEEHSGIHQLLFYVLFKPGGTGSCFFFTWVIFLALDGADPVVPVSADPEAQSWLGRCLSLRLWRPLSRASYWLYLVHPVFFAVAFSQPHLLLPPSHLRLPVPAGYGLAIPRAALAIENASHPLSAWSRPSVLAVTNKTAQEGFVPLEQAHWLTSTVAHDPAPSPLELTAGGWGVITAGVVVSILLAMGLERCAERPLTALMKQAWTSFPGVCSWLDWLVDNFHRALFVLLPVLHVLMHAVWFFGVLPEHEDAILSSLREGIRNTSQADMAVRMLDEQIYRGPRIG